MKKKKGIPYNTIHGKVTGGGGLDKNHHKPRIHGTVKSCMPMNANHVKGPARGMARMKGEN